MTGRQKTTGQKSMTKAGADKPRTGAPLRPITQLVRPLIKEILPQKNIIFQQIFDHWPQIVAGTEAAGSIPEKLTFPRQQQKEGALSVWAKSSAQATEMSYNRMTLMQRINSVFGYALLNEIKITAFQGLALPQAKKPIPVKVNSVRGVPSQSLDKILAGISNPSLRQVLSELGGVVDRLPDHPETDLNPDINPEPTKGDFHA